MKIINLSLVLVLCCEVSFVEAQGLVNNGSVITVMDGSKLIIEGSFHNYLDGNIANAGNISVTGNWINDAVIGYLLLNTTGTVTFSGSSAQSISGNNKTWFSNLIISNNVELASETSVSTLLSISNADLNLLESDLVLEDNALIAGYSATSYIIAENAGQLKRTVSTNLTEFPVGTSVSYVPVILENTGTADLFGVKVFNDVLENGTSGGSISQIDHCVNNTWDISEQDPGGSDLTITAFWTSIIEGNNFDRTACGLGHFYEGTWNPQPFAPAVGNDPFSITRNGITTLSPFAVGDTASPMAIILRLTLDIALFLEGPFTGLDMNTDLNPDLIPLSQPYNISPWNYTGDESVGSMPNPDIVDWILVELRDTTDAELATSETIIARQAAFVLNDGSVVRMDGSSDLEFDISVSNELFVVVWHRNHLGILSASPLVKIDDVYNYNFTTSSGMAYGNGQKSLNGSTYGMFAGDADGNGEIELDDKIIWWKLQAGEAAYHSADFDLDRQVDNIDKDDNWLPNIGEISKVPE
jgi:hypothetical protein